jgi:hypothetical protein
VPVNATRTARPTTERAANRGDCPLGGLQARLGDPVPLFELVLSPQAARRAVPVLGVVTAGGVALLAKEARRPPAGPRQRQAERLPGGVRGSHEKLNS